VYVLFSLSIFLYFFIVYYCTILMIIIIITLPSHLE